ncbi:hypothetical protein [Rhodobacter sp. SY28-1]|uniref:hypothetical protein n=1 Tax=Rhodobacter sp. SY28-1 TaxID=2562317 RepID=UPI0014857A1F|nr:hypothetical protein [Rhodobacter sp. SY28-1]
MSVLPFRRKVAVSVPGPLDPYYQEDPRPTPAPVLRRLTEIEQMYAYWGSDLGNGQE